MVVVTLGVGGTVVAVVVADQTEAVAVVEVAGDHAEHFEFFDFTQDRPTRDANR